MRLNGGQIKRIILICILLTLIGTIGFSVTEQLPPSEAFYQTVLILLSHFDHYGFHTLPARLLVVFLVVSSLIVVVYLLKAFAEYMIGLGDGLKRVKMKAKIKKLDGHYIICGLGRVGSQVAGELADEKIPFVAIDRDEEKVKEAVAAGYIAFVGDSSEEEVLHAAGVARAKGLVASLGDDSSNLFVTLEARQLNPALFIVARVNRKVNAQRMQRAGADRIAMPYQIGGYHMATMLVRPNVVDFLEVLSTNNSSELQVEEIMIEKHSHFAGQKLSGVFSHKTGATFLALNSNDGTSKVNPSGSETVYPGDKLIVMGTKSQLEKVGELI